MLDSELRCIICGSAPVPWPAVPNGKLCPKCDEEIMDRTARMFIANTPIYPDET